MNRLLQRIGDLRREILGMEPNVNELADKMDKLADLLEDLACEVQDIQKALDAKE